MATARFDGMAAFQEKVAGATARVKASAKAANDKSAGEFAAGLEKTTPDDTGELKGTIAIVAGKTDIGAGVSVGEGMGAKARAIEFGHFDHGTHVPKRPYFYPLLRTMQKRFRGRLNRAINKAIKGEITDGGDA